MEPISIRELQRQAGATPWEACLRLQLDQVANKETRQGKSYIELVFADGSDALIIRVWADHAMFPRAQLLQAPMFVQVSGQWVDRGQYGIEPLAWDFRELDEEERQELLLGPRSLREKQAKDLDYIRETVGSLADPRLRELCLRFLQTHEERFLRTAAARNYHHARRGGLVEHVAQMMRAAAALTNVYDDLNADLVFAGVLFHDCGKLWENSYRKAGFTMPHREAGELLGHIPLGIELINKLWRDICEEEGALASWKDLVPRTEDVRLHLLHLVASHHGTHEFGSPVLPKTPEAVLLHFIDNIDAKMEMYKDCYEISPLLGKNVFERRRPMFHSLVRPLPRYETPQTPETMETPEESGDRAGEDSGGEGDPLPRP